MNLADYFSNHKKDIASHLTAYLREKEAASGKELAGHFARLAEFAVRGKMLRGIFVILSYEAYGGGKVDSADINAAAAMELAHSSFLIHDDIMDRDLLRRGQATIFAQYITKAKKDKVPDPELYGQAMGILSGDLAIMMCHELLAKSSSNAESAQKIAQVSAKEIQQVILGQFLDYQFGQTNEEPSEGQILQMYMLKTGGYTFALPLVIGAILAGASEAEVAQLDEMGRNLGTIFQIKDDEMGLFGTEEFIGKPIGTDIRENKKTLIRQLLFEQASPEEKKHLDSLFGNQNLTQEEVKKVCDLIDSHKIRETVGERINKLSQEARQIIQKLNIADEPRKLLLHLEEYNRSRVS